MARFYFVVATIPLAFYLLALTATYCRRAPFAADGRSDLIAAALAAIGFFFIGPGQIMAPWGACAVWGPYVWILVAAFYLLLCSIVASLARHKIVVYRADRDSLRKTLTTVALELDEQARWCGDAMELPTLGLQFFVEYSGLGRVATIVRFGEDRARGKWTTLRRALATKLRDVETSSKRPAFFLGLIAGVLIGADVALVVKHSEEIAEALSFYLSV